MGLIRLGLILFVYAAAFGAQGEKLSPFQPGETAVTDDELSHKPMIKISPEGYVFAHFWGHPDVQLMKNEVVSNVETKMTVNSNTCVNVQNVTCTASLAYRSFLYTWVTLDHKQVPYLLNGSHLDNGDPKPRYHSEFELAYGARTDFFPVEKKVIRLTCNRTDMFPWNGKNQLMVRYVDHDFQAPNREMSDDPENHGSYQAVNSFWSRLASVPATRVNEHQIDLGYTDQQTYPGDNLPLPMIAYRLIFDFVGQNILEPMDKECSVTFNVDFSKVFALSNASFLDRHVNDILKLDLKPVVKLKDKPILNENNKYELVAPWTEDVSF